MKQAFGAIAKRYQQWNSSGYDTVMRTLKHMILLFVAC
jgi:hypothetical protein